MEPADDTLQLVETAEGTRVRLRARPGGGCNEVRGIRNGALLVTVTAAPEKGKANAAILKLLSRWLGVPASRMQITAGKSNAGKTLFVQGLTAAEVRDAFHKLTE